MTLKKSIDWKNEWFPIDDATYLNFAAHAAIPRVALNAVRRSVAAKMQPHIVDDRSFFSVAASLRQTLATLIGASPYEIALTTGAGAGLAAIAYALKWSARDTNICSVPGGQASCGRGRKVWIRYDQDPTTGCPREWKTSRASTMWIRNPRQR